MKTINISISNDDYNRLGLKQNSLSYSEFLDIIKREIAAERLKKSVELAEKHGLSSMSMDEINEEIKKARAVAKDNT